MGDVIPGPSRGVRKPRKSRGRGLRATTGCVICKRRHVKCDEVHPQCGPCAKGRRVCVYAVDAPGVDSSASVENSHQVHEPLRILVDACQQERPVRYDRSPVDHDPRPPSPVIKGRSSLAPDSAISTHKTSPLSTREHVKSPSTDGSTTTQVPPLSWFELLANDAVNADRNFFLSPQHRDRQDEFPDNPGFLPRTAQQHESFRAASFGRDLEIEKGFSSNATAQPKGLPEDTASWTTPAPIQLSNVEVQMFKHYTKHMGIWLDFFDPTKPFSTIVPHIAMRNTGVMKALLALSARHLSLWNVNATHDYNSGVKPDVPPDEMPDPGYRSDIDRNVAVKYYYETLNYLNQAMKIPSYAKSEELITTALLISTYEMVDGTNRDWERHLKGVFWIQRHQNSNGECGGIRQAVWWAWLRQDAWVAMRERRRVFSFWKPRKHYSEMAAPELACYAHYLLGQCINYASREECESTDVQRRLERGNELLFMLQEWHDYLPAEFNPLPTPPQPGLFPPIWINPPLYAASIQLHSLCRILVLLHRPSIGDLQDYRAAQRLLTASVNTIGGISRTVDDDDTSGHLVSLNALFGVGMCVHTPHERTAILEMVDEIQRRVRWPNNSLRKQLEMEYQSDELSGFHLYSRREEGGD